jgi:hypothetical protein
MHPIMDVAVYFYQLWFEDSNCDLLLEARLRNVYRWIFGRVRMNIVQNTVRIDDLDRASGRKSQHVRMVLAGFWTKSRVSGFDETSISLMNTTTLETPRLRQLPETLRSVALGRKRLGPW